LAISSRSIDTEEEKIFELIRNLNGAIQGILLKLKTIGTEIKLTILAIWI